ncbi:MAG TPA: hypothetical protein PK156_15060 [Polyangium sp.]|nr:hypothetical protein [Polyangium sp.]
MSFLFGNGRFEAANDPMGVVSERFGLWKVTFLWSDRVPHGFFANDEYWLPGVDTQTKQPVLIHPRGYGFAWAKDLAFEAIAKRVQSLSLPGTVPILHVGRGVVFAQPLPVRPRPVLQIEHAAQLALDAAIITARLHAEGVGRLGFGPSHLRLLDDNGRWQMHWLIPGIFEIDLLDALQSMTAKERKREGRLASWKNDLGPVQSDVWRLCRFFFSLVDSKSMAESVSALVRLRDEGPDAAGIDNAASLARHFATIAGLSQATVESLPIVCTLPRVFPNWDEVIADGEELLAAEHHYDRSMRLPLGVAYHQRASRSWASGNLEAALGDVDMAISHDSHGRYHTTRAILLDAMNRRAEAQEAIAHAFDCFAKPEPEDRWGEKEDNSQELSRAYFTRGILAWRDGRLDEADADLRQANKLHSSPQVVRAMEKLGSRRR